MSTRPVIYPTALRPGATLGLVATASPPLVPPIIPEIIGRLEAQGFRIKPGANLEKREGYLAGTDEERAHDLHAAFADPEVEGVLALRGGYGSIRLLTMLDYAAIRAAKKAFIGYSDNTALHLALLKKAGLITFHGPNASEAFLPVNEARFRSTLFDPTWLQQPVTLFSRVSDNGKLLKTVVPGRATGQIIGGNMTCLLRLIGTPYEPDFDGVILFLEDTGEKAYRVDGMFTHLRLAGVLDRIAGLVIGQFDHTDGVEQWRIEGCLKREAERIGMPCVMGAPIGHTPEQVIIPQSATAELDATNCLLRVLPPQ